MSKTGMHSTVAKPNQDWEQKANPDLAETQKMLQTINFKLGNFDDENRSFRAIASTPMVDRQGDSIEQSGWILDNFIKNPVIPWAHCYYELPVARATEIGVVDGNLQMTVQFPPEGLYDFADTVWDMYRHGFMFAFSVGFIPHEYEGNWEDGYNFTECELLEVSAVPVPANAGALVLAQKMGIMDNKQAKQMIAKVELALKNFKEANGMNKDSKDVKPVDGDKTVEKVVKLSDLKSVMAELLEEINAEKLADDDTEEKADDAESLTNNQDIVQTDNMTEKKSGASISAANKAKIKDVMDGLKAVMDTLQAHHEALGELYNVGADSADDEAQNDDPDADDDLDGQDKSVEDSKQVADSKSKDAGDVKASENDSEDGADQEEQEEVEDDDSKDESAEEEANEDSADESAEESDEDEAKADDSEEEAGDESEEDSADESEEEDAEEEAKSVDPENLSDEDVAAITQAVQEELDKDNE